MFVFQFVVYSGVFIARLYDSLMLYTKNREIFSKFQSISISYLIIIAKYM